MDTNICVLVGTIGPDTVDFNESATYSSPEVKILSTIFSCLEEIEELMATLEQCLRECRHKVRLTRCAEDLTISAHVAAAINCLLVVERVVTEPLFQRITLMANMLGHSTVERWYQLHQTADPVQKKQLRLKIENHLQASSRFSQDIQTKLTRLGEASRAAFESLKAMLQLLADAEKAKESSSRNRRNHDEAVAFAVVSLTAAVSKSARKLFGITAFAKELSLSTVPDASRGLGFVGDVAERCVSAEKLLASESTRLLNFCGSILHLHVLWNQMAVVIPQLESTDLEPYLAAVSKVRLFEPRANIDHIVKNVVPQIHLVRVQHLTLLEQHPDHVEQHRQLQYQLCALISQTLELFGKEHTVLLSQSCDSASGYLIDFSHVLFNIFGQSVRGCLSIDLSSAAKISDLQLGSSSEETEASVFRRSIDLIVTALRDELRKKPSVLHLRTAEIRRMQCLSQLSEIFLEQAFNGSPRNSCLSLGDLLQNASPLSYSLETRLQEMYQTDEIRCLSPNLEFPLKDHAIRRALSILKRDVARASIVGSTSVTASTVSMHPFYSGMYTVDGVMNSEGTGQEEFPFFVSAHTGAIVFSQPPKRGIERLVANVQKVASSRVLFYVFNTVMCLVASRLS